MHSLQNKMSKWSTLVLVLSSTVFFLAGCEKPVTYAYLIQHPTVLKKELDNCQLTTVNTKAQTERCEIVLYAATTLASLINDMQQDPEKYGQAIMDQEVACVKLKTDQHDLQKALATLSEKNASSAEIDVLKIKLDQAEKKYQEQREKVKAMLAVAGMRRPE